MWWLASNYVLFTKCLGARRVIGVTLIAWDGKESGRLAAALADSGIEFVITPDVVIERTQEPPFSIAAVRRTTHSNERQGM